MCGRFPQSLAYQPFRQSVAPQLPRGQRPRGTRDADNYRPSYNVAPNSNVAVVRCQAKEEKLEGIVALREDEGEEEEQQQDDAAPLLLVQSMRWGLLPPYTKSVPQYKDTMNTINARADVLLSGSPLWSRPFNKGQRCVVFTQGFYEWQKTSSGKMPHFVGMKGEGVGRKGKDGEEHGLMPLAGLWERCKIEGEEEPRHTFTIITTDVCPSLSFLHDRQPLILPSAEAIATWLNPSSPLDDVRKLVRPFDGEGALEWYKVPKEVGKVGNDDEAFIQPVETRKDGIMAAFGRATKKEGDASGHAESSKTAKKEAGRDPEQDLAIGSSASSSSVKKESLPSRAADKQDVGDSNAPPPTTSSAVKEEPQASSSRQPSSRFSPDPFNPPVSPPRPNGGYSSAEYPDSGLTKYGKVTGPGHSVGKKRGESPPGGEEARLEGAFKRQKVKQEVEEAVKDWEENEMGEQRGDEGGEQDGQAISSGKGSSPGKATTPNSKPGGASRSAGSPTRSTTTTLKKRGGGGGSGSPQGRDIRAFFSKE